MAIVVSPLSASAAWMKCTVDSVAELDKLRLQLMCKESVSDAGVSVSTFAIGYGSTATETARAARFFTMAQTALASGKPLGVYFTSGAVSSAINCTGTCRVIDGFQLYGQ